MAEQRLIASLWLLLMPSIIHCQSYQLVTMLGSPQSAAAYASTYPFANFAATQSGAQTVQIPASTVQYPANTIQYPSNTVQYLTNAVQYPANTVQYPATYVQPQIAPKAIKANDLRPKTSFLSQKPAFSSNNFNAISYDYKYDPRKQPTFNFDPANPQKTFDYKYNYDGPKYDYDSADININIPAAELVDSALAETRVQGAKIVRVLQKLTDNKLIARAIAATGTSNDPCAFIPSDIDATVEELINGIGNSREPLIQVIAAVQDMKRYEDDTARVIKSASEAVLAMEPMLPMFNSVFKTNAACDNSIQATVNKFDGVSNVLDTLGRTNLVSRNENDKIRLIQGAEASRAISRTAVNLDKIQFTRLCSDSPTFTSDVFTGVGELLNGLKDISASFNAGGNNSLDAGKLDQTVKLLKDGAELLNDLDITDAPKTYARSSSCVTSLPAVAKSLAEVGELIDVIEPESLKALGI